MFDGVAARSTVLSFSVGMQFAITITTATVGAVCIALMLRQAPWKAMRGGTKPEPTAAGP
jgi:hypothetical protein